MYNKKPIYCPHCKKVAFYEEDLRHMVIPREGLSCPHCGKIAVKNSIEVTW